MPDIDTDFDDEGRQKVIDYVVDKYGKNQVAQIITYGTMAAKMSIKDVARVLDLPLAESNMLAKLVPDKPGTELRRVLHAPLTIKEGEKSLEEKEAYQQEDIDNVKKIREIYNGNDIRAQVLHEAERLEGSVRNTGIHAAGIIIAPKDLTDLLPVAVSKDSDLWVTQIEGSVIEDAGVIKMDFLGLKTLSILKTALELIKQNHGVEIDLDTIALDDEKTFQLYQKGETNATFQFESVGMQKYLRELKPDKFDDLIAMNALYRPGPIAYIPKFIDRKHGREAISYDLEDMKEYLEDTYGITVYQEQVMLLSQSIGGFTKGDADVLRKAMGKKQKSVLDKMKAQFISGATAKGHAPDKLEKIWTDWEAFAQYAFNKSHSTCYAFVAYQTAYLKAHYPGEYMSAVLNHAGAIEKITFFMEECKRMGIKVLGPDINESLKGFAVNQRGEIRFGLGGLKGVGDAAVDTIIAEREKNGEYKDIFDFIKRVLQKKRKQEIIREPGLFRCF
jgi:DNA polymerase-3 subunit alpha